MKLRVFMIDSLMAILMINTVLFLFAFSRHCAFHFHLLPGLLLPLAAGLLCALSAAREDWPKRA